MVVSLCIGLRYEVSVEVEVDDNVLVGLAVDPGHGEVVCMSSLLLLRKAWLNLAGGNMLESIWGNKLRIYMDFEVVKVLWEIKLKWKYWILNFQRYLIWVNKLRARGGKIVEVNMNWAWSWSCLTVPLVLSFHGRVWDWSVGAPVMAKLALENKLASHISFNICQKDLSIVNIFGFYFKCVFEQTSLSHFVP